MRAAFGARQLRPELLTGLRLMARHQGREVPTVGGLILFGRARGDRFPDAWLQLGRFAGVDRARVLDHAELRGPLVGAIDEAVAFVAKHAWRGITIEGVRHAERWNLPPVAVRELIVNAVAHADYALRGAPLRVAVYDDRLEVENPGLLPFGLSVDDLPRGVSKLRNRVIARVFRELGLVEHWGSGVPRVIAACRDAGLPTPRWEEIGLRFRATLPAVPTTEPQLDAIDRGLLRALEGGDGRRTRDLAAGVGLTTRATRTRLARLVERGLVRDVGLGPNDPRRHYVAVDRAVARVVDDAAVQVDPD
jgi:predicted HTH transcriptional regulator